MKILIVDDDSKRANLIRQLFINEVRVPTDNIVITDNINAARKIIKESYYDVLILDVILPKRYGDVAAHNNGIEFLQQISESRGIKRPEKIVGITANVEDIGQYSTKFQEYCLSVIEAKRSDHGWQTKLVNAIKYTVESKEHRLPQESSLVVTVHGIRTFGKWQNRLRVLALQNYDNLDFHSYKFGFFTSVMFFFPWFRNYEVRKFQSKLQTLVYQNPEKTIKIFSHSFGTDIVVRAIENLIKSGISIPIDKLILSGSILKSNHDWSTIMTLSEARVINECGISDFVLWLSNAFVPFAGMAGRIGFLGLNNSRIINRYYKGGHSLYFHESDKFISEYWLPLFRKSESECEYVDEREYSLIIDSIFQPLIIFFGWIKEAVYLFAFLFILIFLFY